MKCEFLYADSETIIVVRPKIRLCVASMVVCEVVLFCLLLS